MLSAIVITAILSIQLVSVHPGTVEKCLDGGHHKKFPSIEGADFATCLPWQNKPTCCTAETTMDLKKNGVRNLFRFDWDHCGTVSEVRNEEMIMNERKRVKKGRGGELC